MKKHGLNIVMACVICIWGIAIIYSYGCNNELERKMSKMKTPITIDSVTSDIIIIKDADNKTDTIKGFKYVLQIKTRY